jgi:hypothetical protein
MASFLSFVYKRSSGSAGPGYDNNTGREAIMDEDVENTRQLLHPGVSSSNSSDTAWGSLQSSQDDDEFVHATMTRSEDTDDLFVSPFTPDGLLPRKSADILRRELNVPRVLEHSLRRAQGRQEPLSGVAKILSDKDSAPPFRTERHFDKGILPPPPDCLLNKPSFESSIQSPPVSTSSFYSRNTCSENRIAMSPVLQVGQARTAVGALVALREAANHHSNATSALPPFPTEKMHEKNIDKNQSFATKALPPRNDFMAYPDNDDDSETPSENENDIPYLALDDNNDKTPARRLRSDSLDSV